MTVLACMHGAGQAQLAVGCCWCKCKCQPTAAHLLEAPAGQGWTGGLQVVSGAAKWQLGSCWQPAPAPCMSPGSLEAREVGAVGAVALLHAAAVQLRVASAVGRRGRWSSAQQRSCWRLPARSPAWYPSHPTQRPPRPAPQAPPPTAEVPSLSPMLLASLTLPALVALPPPGPPSSSASATSGSASAFLPPAAPSSGSGSEAPDCPRRCAGAPPAGGRQRASMSEPATECV